MEKIIINPEDVRGLGNVVSSKSTSDFVLYDAEISSATESVNDMNLTVYHLQLSSLGILSVSVSSQSVTVGGAVTVTATVVDRLGTPIPDVPVTISCGSYSFDATDTNSSGQVTKSYTTTSSDVGSMSVTAASEGYTTATTYVSVNKHVSDLSMSIADSSVDVGQTFDLSGVLKIDNVGTSGLKIKIYQDDVCIDDDVTTGTSGAWSKSVYAVTVGTTVFKAVYEGSSVNASDETSEYTCTVSLNSTNLNITVPALVYSDEFDVTGVLTDNSNNPISNASIKLRWMVGGIPYEASPETTDSSGSVTFHSSAPTSITTYTFWLEFSGTSVYGPSNSSVVSRTVGKETTVLSVSSPSNNASFDSGDSVTVSGTLLTNDSEKLPSGTTVYIKENGTTLGSASVSTSDGSFSTTLNGLSDGSHTLTIEYVESTNYLGSSVTRTVTLVPEATISTLSLVADKNILSYADSESATLTATALTSQNVGVPDQLVMFYSGTPDIVDDCTSGTALSTITGSPTFDSNGMTIHNGDKVTYNPSQFVMDLTTKSYKIYATCTKPTGGDYLGLVIVDSYGDPHYKTAVFIGDSTIDFLDSTVSTPSGLGSTINVCVELNPTSQKLYIDGSLVTTKSIDYSESASGFDEYIYLGFWDNLEFTVTNLVVFEDNSSAFVAYDVTDSNGVASVTYQSKGTGDITIQASCNNITSSSVSIEDCLYAPKLDGTETIHQVQGTTTISNGEMSGGSGYIGAFDNSNNWELSFDGKLSDGNCGLWLIKSDETSRDTNDVLLLLGNIYTHVNGSGAPQGTVGTVLSANTYYSFKYTKNGNNLTIVVDNTYTKTIQWNLLSTLSTLAIGLDSWGGTATIKNIKVKPL